MNPPQDLLRAMDIDQQLLCELPITMLVSTNDMRIVQELFPHTTVMDDV
jgi:hypothetical protein